MPTAESQIETLKRAYRILGVPVSASAHSIKQAYRRLAKRWHPDLCAGARSDLDQAAEMIKVINWAYSTVARAPLRYHIESYPRARQRKDQTPVTGSVARVATDRDTLPVTDRVEFWVRFVCGALLGALMSLGLILTSWSGPVMFIVGACMSLLFGFATVRYGDSFWLEALEDWLGW